MPPSLRFQLWGPVTATVDGEPTSLGPARQRCVLAVLLQTPGHAVPTDELIRRVWDDDPPAGVRGVLATYASRLRTALAEPARHDASVLQHTTAGYLIDCAPDAVDLQEMRLHAARARAHVAAGDYRWSAELFDLARRACAGEPLGGLRRGVCHLGRLRSRAAT